MHRCNLLSLDDLTSIPDKYLLAFSLPLDTRLGVGSRGEFTDLFDERGKAASAIFIAICDGVIDNFVVLDGRVFFASWPWRWWWKGI
jgi:hypothetical protein